MSRQLLKWWSGCQDNSLTDKAILMKLYTGAVYNRMIQCVHVDECPSL